ncbi:uncharacterized protein BJ212DRAFT_1402272 [Suillus subaureus]|uniref:Uncharacterized protein n=1 Tax=Suillus subaureus TaxID=48587 RepID=A0A9P7J1T9_9AGAM|nr:uncharacterized protein BJ212DRAFT_1402272 [Suillus subaureus]KAG1799167.1 hypothetical protein BJ212DRAFT_1402272 [Suillus subaureus]
MPSEPDHRTLLIPVNLGTPAQYDRSIFPLMRLKDQSGLAQADLVLEATLDEVFKIREMAADKTHVQDLVAATKLAYDKLVLERDRLEQQKKSINPVKLFSAYRSTRLLVEAGKKLYTNTRTTSERMRRQLLSVASKNVERVEYDNLPSDACISGIAVSLDEPLDEPTASYFTEAANFIASRVDLLSEENPFADDFQVEDSGASAGTEPSSTADSATNDDGVASPSSPRLSETSPPGSGNNYFIFNNSYVASRSVISTPTLNHGGSHNQGLCSYSPHLSCVVVI